jgi:hypothetical protein
VPLVTACVGRPTGAGLAISGVACKGWAAACMSGSVPAARWRWPRDASGQPTPRPMFASVSASACSTWSASSALVVDRWIVTVELPGSASATCSQPW